MHDLKMFRITLMDARTSNILFYMDGNGCLCNGEGARSHFDKSQLPKLFYGVFVYRKPLGNYSVS